MPERMTEKTTRLDLEALIGQVVLETGYVHYGYFDDPDLRTTSLQALGRAQVAYVDRILAMIPPGVKTILDVGSGTGSIAAGLVRAGYRVDCLCPSARMNRIARGKLPAESRIFESLFEEATDLGRYDMLLFAESFHYIDTRAALRKIDACAAGHFMIIDYFPRADGTTPNAPSHRQFLALVTELLANRFVAQSDTDITPNILPTFRILDGVSNEHLKPFAAAWVEQFRAARPVLATMLFPFLRRRIERLQVKSRREESFPAKFEYRHLLFSRA